MIRSGRRGEKEGARDGGGEGNTWEIRGGWSGRKEKLREEILTGDSQGGAELLEERRDGDSRVKPQEPESDLGGGKVVTHECAQSLRYAQAGCKRRQRDWRRGQRDNKGGGARPWRYGVDGEVLIKGGVAACKGRELEGGDERWELDGSKSVVSSPRQLPTGPTSHRHLPISV
ncbi:hypothetical protein B0H13DRAFT_1974408 [Mycena leptocephala]|nr:hypothetical protein B0H13DRAFT_1974408 [Mycena leptocephala]